MVPFFIGNVVKNTEAELEFKVNEDSESMIRYYESVYSLKVVGMFALKEEYDRESTIQFAKIFGFKTTHDFIYLKVNYNNEELKFDYEAYIPMKNVLFQDILIFNQKVPIKIEFVPHSYLKGKLKSHSRYFFWRQFPR